MSEALPQLPPVEAQAFFCDQLAEMRRRLTVVREMPGLEEFAQTRRMPGAFFTEFNAALACFDRIIDFVLAYDGTDRRVQCTKGCSNCCIDLVRGITTPEVINIYNHVRPWPDARELFLYHKESAELFTGILMSKLTAGEAEFAGSDDRVEQAHREFNQLNRPCGFLDRATGCCRIYPVRPIACRYFFSMDPPETCSPLHVKYFNRDTRTIHLPQDIHDLLAEIAKRFGLRTLNYLSGGFCAFAAETMRAKMIEVV